MPEIVLDDLCKDFDGHVAAPSYGELWDGTSTETSRNYKEKWNLKQK